MNVLHTPDVFNAYIAISATALSLIKNSDSIKMSNTEHRTAENSESDGG
jgi:hypothetical protein